MEENWSTEVKIGKFDIEYTSDNNSRMTSANDHTLNVQILDRSLTDRITQELDNIVRTVEKWIQEAILVGMGSIIFLRIKWAVRPINPSSGRYVACVVTSSEGGEQVGITTTFINASCRKHTSHETNSNDKTGRYNPDEAVESPVTRGRFDWWSHTYHTTHLIDGSN